MKLLMLNLVRTLTGCNNRRNLRYSREIEHAKTNKITTTDYRNNNHRTRITGIIFWMQYALETTTMAEKHLEPKCTAFSHCILATKRYEPHYWEVM